MPQNNTTLLPWGLTGANQLTLDRSSSFVREGTNKPSTWLHLYTLEYTCTESRYLVLVWSGTWSVKWCSHVPGSSMNHIRVQSCCHSWPKQQKVWSNWKTQSFWTRLPMERGKHLKRKSISLYWTQIWKRERDRKRVMVVYQFSESGVIQLMSWILISSFFSRGDIA